MPHLPAGAGSDDLRLSASGGLAGVRSSLLQVEVPCSKLQRSFHCKELYHFQIRSLPPQLWGMRSLLQCTLDALDLGHLRLSLNSGNRDVYFQQEEALRAKCESGAEIGQSRVFLKCLNDQEFRGATLGSWWRDIAIFQYNKMEKTK